MARVVGPLTIKDIETEIYPGIEPILRRLHLEPVDITNRDNNRLDAALNAPFASYEGQDAYPGVTRKAAAYLYIIAKDHPFFDGNKRVAVVSCLYYLFLNDLWLFADPVDFYRFTREVVSSKQKIGKNIDRIEKYLRENARPLVQRLQEIEEFQ